MALPSRGSTAMNRARERRLDVNDFTEPAVRRAHSRHHGIAGGMAEYTRQPLFSQAVSGLAAKPQPPRHGALLRTTRRASTPDPLRLGARPGNVSQRPVRRSSAKGRAVSARRCLFRPTKSAGCGHRNGPAGRNRSMQASELAGEVRHCRACDAERESLVALITSRFDLIDRHRRCYNTSAASTTHYHNRPRRDLRQHVARRITPHRMT